MRGFVLGLAACLLAAGGWDCGTAAAAQRAHIRNAGVYRPGQENATPLADIMRSPGGFTDRDVLFFCRFATTGDLFKDEVGGFDGADHVNFAVWPDRARLWENNGRSSVLPTLSAAKNNAAAAESLRAAGRYELLAVTGRVTSDYAGYPWIEVTRIERIETPAERLDERVVELMRSGREALRAVNGAAAVRDFEQAIQMGLPHSFRGKAFEDLAHAYFLENRLDRARDCLRRAVEADRADPDLHIALADVALRMGNANEAMAHCQYALERSGHPAQVYGIRGEARSLQGEFGKAFADLNKAAAAPGIPPREMAMINVRAARIYARAARYADATRLYAAVSGPGELLGSDAWLHNEIGLFHERLYLETGDAPQLDLAYAAFEEAACLNGLEPAYLYSQAEVEFRRQRLAGHPQYSTVAALLARIGNLDGEYVPARILEGRMLYGEGNVDEADSRYQSIAGKVGANPTAMLALAEAYMDLGHHDRAAATVVQARRMQPWNHRVQALGQYVEENATLLAKREIKAQAGHWLDDSARAEQRPEVDDAIRGAIAEAAQAVPQDIQTMTSSSEGAALPKTVVRLKATPSATRFAEPGPEAVEGTAEGFGEKFGRDFEWEGATKGMELDDDGFLKFSQVVGVREAYASMNAGPADTAMLADAEEPRIPRPFTFQPDDSPVIIAGVRSPGSDRADLPARNANVYRRLALGRQPAEIIEKEPVSAKLPSDTPAMAPAAGGVVRRAEVKLPSSSRGVGMASDYAPGR